MPLGIFLWFSGTSTNKSLDFILFNHNLAFSVYYVYLTLFRELLQELEQEISLL